MAVVVYLTSGDRRKVENANAARLDQTFFVIANRQPDTGKTETILTLWAPDVVGAEVLIDGVRVEYISGLATPPHSPQES